MQRATDLISSGNSRIVKSVTNKAMERIFPCSSNCGKASRLLDQISKLVVPSTQATAVEKHRKYDSKKSSDGTRYPRAYASHRTQSTYCMLKLAASSMRHSNNSIRLLHTSCRQNAITKEELALLAKVRQVRESKEKKSSNIPSVQKMQENLTSKARERKVPSSRLGRIMSFGGLAAGLAAGTLTNSAKKAMGQETNASGINYGSSLVLNDANMTRIVDTLCRVRGAALKIGQMLSIQDDTIVNPQLLALFDRVRQSADYMPVSQMHKVLVAEFGPNWRDLVKEFDDQPFAAASIGQVHRCVLHDGREVAMKIQYPGVANSIDSDIDNLVTLLKVWDLFPPQFFIDKFVAVARRELSWECDYIREAAFARKFKEVLGEDSIYGVPGVIDELSTKHVITTELIQGVPIDQVKDLDQDTRNYVGAAILQLVLREVFEFRCMQTDPNYANFFYNEDENKLYLLDFGASRTYPKEFVDMYIEMVKKAADLDRDSVLDLSYKLGFLTGFEPQVMKDAHVDAILTVGEPFSVDGHFDFATQSTTREVSKHVPVFMKHRLTAPPEETYSLHRKLSGAFLMSMKLRSKFACKPMFDEIYDQYWTGEDKSLKIPNFS